MVINSKFAYIKKKEVFEPLITTIPKGLNPIVFIEDTREMWICGTYFSIGYPSIEISESSGSVKVSIGNSFFLLSTTGESISVRKGDGNRIIISSNALNRVDTEAPLTWDITSRKLLHMDSGVVPGSYGQSTNLGNASVFIVPNIMIDSTGHITYAQNYNVEIRDYVEQLAPSTLAGNRNVLLSYNADSESMDTSQVRKANGLLFNDSTQRLTVEGGLDTNGPVFVNHGDLSVLDGYIIGHLKGDVEGEAKPKIHLSNKPEYGGASINLYGHVKLQDVLNTKPDPSSDNENINNTNVTAAIAASPLMVWNAIQTAKDYADSVLGSNNAMLYKGSLEAGITYPGTYTPTGQIGNTYVVTFGSGNYIDSIGYINGEPVEIGDLIICKEETPAATSTTWEEVKPKWTYVQTNNTGVVSGPSSSTIGQLAVFNNTKGKLIKGLPNGNVGQILSIDESGIPAWVNKPDRLNYALSFQVNETEFVAFDGYEPKKVNFIAGDNMFITSDAQGNLTLAADPGSDTVNTAGATNNPNTKLFLIGAESQTTAPQTYSNQYVYIGPDNCLYSLGKKVLTDHQTIYNLDLQTLISGETTKVTTFDPNAANSSFTLVQGTNITLVPDAQNKRVTISSKDTTYDFYNLIFKQGETVIDTYKPTTSPDKAFKAGTNVTFSKNGDDITITTQDTRNTAGTTEKANTKLFLVGAESQGANPQTYSNAKVYIGIDGKLYSDNKEVSTGDHIHNYAGAKTPGGPALKIDLNPDGLLDAEYGTYGGIIQDSNNGPTSGSWSNRIKILHNDSSGYYTELAQNLTGTAGVWHRRNVAGVISEWIPLLDKSNFHTYLDGTYIQKQTDPNQLKNFVRYSLESGLTINWTAGNVTPTQVIGFKENNSAQAYTFNGDNIRAFANAVNRSGDTMSGNLTTTGIILTTTTGITHNGKSSSLLYCDGTNSFVGMSSATTYIRSGNTDLFHKKNGTDYKIWDASNLVGLQTAHSHNTINIIDSRDRTSTPQEHPSGVWLDFKSNANAGLDDGGTYTGLLTVRKYGSTTDWAGGKVAQLGFTDNSNVWVRFGSGTAWESWKQIATTGWADGKFLPLAGGTMTGSITISTDSVVQWSRNTDYAKIHYKNTSDSDADSYLGFEVGDNGNEYFKFSSKNGSTTTQWASIKSDGIRAAGFKKSSSSDSYILLGGGGHKSLSNIVGGSGQSNHGSQSTAYTADTYSSTYVNKSYAAFVTRGGWNYAGNGYITTDFGNIHLAGTAIFQWGANDTNKTQLFITPLDSSGVSSPLVGEMLYYSSNGSGYAAGWTRVLTNRNYSGILDSRYVNVAGDTMTGALTINTSTYPQLTVQGTSSAYINYKVGSVNTFSGYVNGYGMVMQNGSNYINITNGGSFLINNANKIWHAGNDGSGSGLDADTVDGFHSGSFHREWNLGMGSDAKEQWVVMGPAYNGTILTGFSFFGTITIQRGTSGEWHGETTVYCNVGAQYNSNKANYFQLGASVTTQGFYKILYNGSYYIAFGIGATSSQRFKLHGVYYNNFNPFLISGTQISSKEVISSSPSIIASVSKLGTSTVGSASLPIYLSSGTPTACTPSSVFSNLSNSGNNLSITVAGQNRTLTVAYASTAGSVSSATSATYAGKVRGEYTGNGGQQNPNYFGVNWVGFRMMNTTVNGNSNYKDWIISDCYSGRDVGGAVAFGVNRQQLGAYIMGSNADRTSWTRSGEFYGTWNLNPNKVGTVSVGSGTKPIYLSSGTPTASSSSVGNTYVPVYLSSGTITSCGYSFKGSSNQPIVVAAGSIYKSGSSWYFSGKQHSSAGAVSITMLGARMQVSVSNAIICAANVNQSNTVAIPGAGTGDVYGAGSTASWFSVFCLDASYIYIRNMYQRNKDNDSWSSDAKGWNNINRISVIMIGYVL